MQTPATPTITSFKGGAFIGMCQEMSFQNDSTQALWQSFMPRKNEVLQTLGSDLYSIEEYPKDYDFKTFKPQLVFEKWAAVPVPSHSAVPKGMQRLQIPAGQYAVFIHKGLHSTFFETAQYIFGEWLPHSGFQLSARPHFERMTERYLGPLNPDSEEEVWVPIERK